MTTHVTLIGNLTRDPEMRFTTGGKGTCTFGMACSRRYQVNGEWQEQTSFLNVVCWGPLAEAVVASVGKGHRVLVSGRLDQRSWEDKEGGKRSTVEVVADDVGLSCRFATITVERNTREKVSVGADEEPF